MHSMILPDSLSDTNTSGIPFWCTCPVYRRWSWLLLWTRQDWERFYVSSVYLVINTELCQDTEYRIWTQISRVHSTVVKAADCRSAGPWFNSGWRTLFTFMTWYDKLTNPDLIMINIMSPIETSIRTITRKSVNRSDSCRSQLYSCSESCLDSRGTVVSRGAVARPPQPHERVFVVSCIWSVFTVEHGIHFHFSFSNFFFKK